METQETSLTAYGYSTALLTNKTIETMKNMITEIRYGSKWVAIMEFSICIGSNSMNPNTKSLKIPLGTILQWEEDSKNGNVWFNVEIDGEKYRGKIESGAITNVIKSGRISPYGNNEKGIIAYDGEYLQKLLNK
jgi:flagellar hook assembly protein FlgD